MKLPQGYAPHELPADYTGPLFIEGQMRAVLDELSASQAREAKLRDALTKIANNTIHWYESIQAAKAALSLPTDDTALKELLAASQAREVALREALQTFIEEHEDCEDSDDWAAYMCSIDAVHEAENALDIPTDDNALKELLAEGQAHEREACAKACEIEGLNWPPSRDFTLCAAVIRARGGK